MPISLNTNASNLSTLNRLSQNNKKQKQQFDELATGKKDPKKNIVSNSKAVSVEATIRGINQATDNIGNSKGATSVASGGLSSSLENLQNLRELAVRAADDTLSNQDRNNINQAANANIDQVRDTASNIEFDGKKLLDGSLENANIQVGADAGDNIQVSLEDASPESLNVDSIDLSSATTASASIEAIDTAITEVTSQLSNIGSIEKRLDSTEKNNQTRLENLSLAKQNLEETDIAKALTQVQSTNITKAFSVELLAKNNQTKGELINQLI